MAINLLSVRQIEAARVQPKPYSLRDGGSLFLHVQTNGSKLWRYRYRIGGRPQVYAIGKYPAVSLQAARAERNRARDLVDQGVHPLTDKKLKLARQQKANDDSFKKVADEWLASNPEWSHGYANQIHAYLQKDVFPSIGNLPITAIKAPHLREVLNKVAGRGAKNAAILIRQWMGQVFSYAIIHDICDNNPALYLKGLIKRPTVRHHPPLSWTELPVF